MFVFILYVNTRIIKTKQLFEIITSYNIMRLFEIMRRCDSLTCCIIKCRYSDAEITETGNYNKILSSNSQTVTENIRVLYLSCEIQICFRLFHFEDRLIGTRGY